MKDFKLSGMNQLRYIKQFFGNRLFLYCTCRPQSYIIMIHGSIL